MTETTNIQLPLLEGMQAQKHITVNEALQKLDILIHLTVQSRTLTTPPTTPSDGQSWIIPASPTDDWTGRTGQIAAWQEGAWFYIQPKTGWKAWVSGEVRWIHYNGAVWSDTLGHVTVSSLSLTPSPLSTATAGGGATLPATTAGFMKINLSGIDYKIPLYL